MAGPISWRLDPRHLDCCFSALASYKQDCSVSSASSKACPSYRRSETAPTTIPLSSPRATPRARSFSTGDRSIAHQIAQGSPHNLLHLTWGLRTLRGSDLSLHPLQQGEVVAHRGQPIPVSRMHHCQYVGGATAEARALDNAASVCELGPHGRIC